MLFRPIGVSLVGVARRVGAGRWGLSARSSGWDLSGVAFGVGHGVDAAW